MWNFLSDLRSICLQLTLLKLLFHYIIWLAIIKLLPFLFGLISLGLKT